MIKINKALIDPLTEKASNSDRKRTNLNFHEYLNDPLQRMLNIMDKNTYIQPHKHENPDKREAFIILKGKGVIVEFDDYGAIVDYIVLNPLKESFGCEIPAKTWHTIISLESNTVFYEVKDGPYDPTDDKVFAQWAPTEEDKKCNEFNNKVLKEIGLI